MRSQANTTFETGGTVLAIISLGSNQASKFGSPQAILGASIERLRSFSDQPLLVSSLYQTEPCDCPAGTADFLNGAVAMQVPHRLNAQQLLARLFEIEVEFGRQRGIEPNQPRSLDLDLIAFGDQESNSPKLILPHPRAHQRRFVLEPVAEICPQFVLPGQSKSAVVLLSELGTSEKVRRIASLEL